MLTASTPGLTAHGSTTNEKDGYIDLLKIVEYVDKTDAMPSSPDDVGCEAHAAHIILRVGSATSLKIDAVYGYVSIFPILRHIELLCTTDLASLKNCVRSWFKNSSSTTIASALLRRDRGSGRFERTEDSILEYFVHPAFLLGNMNIGTSTRLWLVSVAAFSLSYHQITKAIEQTPRDFARIDEHIDSLTARIRVLHSRRCISKLCRYVLSTVKLSYAETDWQSVVVETISRLALLARCDLIVFRYIKEHGIAACHQQPSRKEKKMHSHTVTLDVSTEQLKFLETIAASNGDLWMQSSIHAYTLGDKQSGAIVVLPSGHLYTITGGSGVSAQELLKDRTACGRFESIIPYLPYELSSYTGDISRLGSLEAVHRGRKPGSIPAKVDLENVKANITSQMLLFANAILLSPLLFELMREKEKKPATPEKKSRSPSPPQPPKAVEETVDEEAEEEEDEETEE